MFANLCQVRTHSGRILLVDDIQQLVQLGTDTFYVCRSTRVEQDFLQQEVVFAHHSLGDSHVALESSTRCILMLHHRSEGKGGNKRDRQGVSHGFIVLLECIFKNVQSQSLIQILEENLAQMVAFLDDDGIFRTQLVEVGKGWTKHGIPI